MRGRGPAGTLPSASEPTTESRVLTYAHAGVDIDRANRAKQRVAQRVTHDVSIRVSK